MRMEAWTGERGTERRVVTLVPIQNKNIRSQSHRSAMHYFESLHIAE